MLGIIGPWGSGKSSLINLIVNSLTDEARPSRPVLVHFNPWRYAGTERLFANFFAALARAIGATDKIETLRKAAEKMRQTSAALGALKVIAPIGGGLIGGLGSLAMSGAENVDALIEGLGTLDALHDDLAAELERAKVRLFVVIDDIDRLSPAEILQTFQLVKSLADFPYVMYLLAYDEDVVLRAIDNDPVVARQYLEKIVSLPIDVPPPHRAVIDNMVIGSMIELLRPEIPAHVDDERLIGSYINGYRHYFRTLRDVRRFSNLFAFNYARVGKTVDVGDLATLTALQVFEHALHALVGKSPSTFIDNDEALWRQDRKDPKEAHARIEAVLERARCADSHLAVQVLRDLFPKVDLAYKGGRYELSFAKARAEARISSPEHFHLFFNMGVPPTDITAEEYREALALGCKETDGFLAFSEALGIDKVIDFVSRLRDDKTVTAIGREARVALIISLYALAERFERRVPITLISLPFDWRIGYAISHVLAGCPPGEWYDDLFASVASASYGIGPAVSEVDRISRMQGNPKTGIPALTEEQVKNLQDAAAKGVRAALRSSGLAGETYLGHIVHSLRTWGQDLLVDEIIATMRSSADTLISYLGSMQQRGGFEGILKPKSMRFSLEGVEKEIPRDDVLRLLAPLRDSNYGDDRARQIVRDFLAQASGEADAADEES